METFSYSHIYLMYNSYLSLRDLNASPGTTKRIQALNGLFQGQDGFTTSSVLTLLPVTGDLMLGAGQ